MKVTPKRPRARASVSAFTLIELLVVISIIAIIAAILFPVFAQVREKARETTCISNLRQVGIAVREYVTDNDETFPIFQAYNVADDHSTGFAGTPWALGHLGVEMEVNPYIVSHDIFRCPDDAGDPTGTANYSVTFGSSYRFDRGSYTVIAGSLGSYQNDAEVTEPDGVTLVPSNTIVTDSSFQNESGTRIMRDEEFPWFGPQVDPAGLKYGYNVSPVNYYKAWHPRGGGIVFADGHAKFVVSELDFDNIAGDADGSTYNTCVTGDPNCGYTTPATVLRCWTSCD